MTEAKAPNPLPKANQLGYVSITVFYSILKQASE
jgi:hypothetical protein